MGEFWGMLNSEATDKKALRSSNDNHLGIVWKTTFVGCIATQELNRISWFLKMLCEVEKNALSRQMKAYIYTLNKVKKGSQKMSVLVTALFPEPRTVHGT